MSLLMFTGTECPHCDLMRPLVARLQYDTGAVLEERDTWKKQSDYRLLENYQQQVNSSDCDGIPFFYNTLSKKYLCGEVSYKQLKSWAMDESLP